MTPADAYARFDAMREALNELRDADAVQRLWDRDASLWSDDSEVQAAIADRLGWFDVAGGQPEWSGRLREFADGVEADGIDRVVLAGMGGSSLAPDVFSDVFADQHATRLVVLDSTHPDAVREILPDDGLATTLVVVSSKSGTTAETRAFALRAERQVPSTRHLAAITDPGSNLAEEAGARGWRAVFTNPADIGGRYSALSLFGMVPAALIGVDIDAVWRSGAQMLTACGPTHEGIDNPALTLAAFMGGHARAGRDKLTILTSPALDTFADWLEQLIAESTGKQGTGIVPVVREPVAAPTVYGDDRAFVVVEHRADPVPGIDELQEAGFPVLRITVDDRHDIGGEFVRWEAATALAGGLLGIDPFDQPNVAESKQNTNEVLDEVAAGTTLPDPEDGDVDELLASVETGDYLSIQAYLAPDPKIADGITELRMIVRDNLKVATTAGWGPRFLHSTGQLHKGGPNSVVVLQLVDVPDEDVEIPDRDHGFATLIRAQALGDLRSLRSHDRRVVQRRVAGPEDIVRLIGDARALLHKPMSGQDSI
ncbi:MAG: glucose-6-phosphate isomerase [Actinobacteria bacterium]|nr:glucose-6-phosphate isomerase [Actinomycetota bacterium]